MIRPGKPNKAASGFFSSILREPLVGQEAVLPVSETVRHWFASPRAAVKFLLHAAELDTAPMGSRRSLTMPGLAATVGDEIEALRRIAGDKAAKLIRREPDEAIAKIVAGWPQNFDASRAAALGFKAENSFDEIIRAHVEDELDGALPHRDRGPRRDIWTPAVPDTPPQAEGALRHATPWRSRPQGITTFLPPKFRQRAGTADRSSRSLEQTNGTVKRKSPRRAWGFLAKVPAAAGYSAGDGFFLNIAMRLSHSSILAPWRFMMTPCWMIDSVLFQAQ